MAIVDQMQNGRRSLRGLAILVFSGLGILVAGLWYLQVVSSYRYKSSLKYQTFRTVRLPAIRGKILDREGHPLAQNVASYNIDLYLEELRDLYQKQYARAKVSLRRHLKYHPTHQQLLDLGRHTRFVVTSNIVYQVTAWLQEPMILNEKAFHRHYEQRLALPMPILENLNDRQVARFAERSGDWPGVELEFQPRRIYPNGPLAGQILGYGHLQRTAPDTGDEGLFFNYRLPQFHGVTGLEGAFDQYLRGKPGIETVLVNNLGYRQDETVWTPAEPGLNVVLTINLTLQKACEQALHMAGANTRGAIVVLNVRNGDVLAMASSPAYDPNDFVPHLSFQEWRQLLNPKLRPLVNRAVGENYLPGSVFKIVTSLACLQSGVLDPHQIFDSPGYFRFPGRHSRPIGDTAPAGPYDFRRAFKRSSNTYFIHFGLLAGIDNILKIARQFHFGEKTGIPTLQEVPGLLPSPAWKLKTQGEPWYDGDTAFVSIGQGYLDVTPIQVAVMVAAVANGGIVFWPRLVKRIEPQDPNTGPVYSFPAASVRNHLNVDPTNLALVRDAMLADVEDLHGTGTRAAIRGFRIAGKTGTAQVRGDEGQYKDTWFASFGPYENPKYAVIVMVVNGVSGGSTCAPMAHHVYKVIQALEDRRPAVLATAK